MNASGDAAEQIVRMTLQGVEVAGKMSMDGAERLVKLILASLKDTKRTKGRASLNTMLKSNKPIKVFELKDKDFKIYARNYAEPPCLIKKSADVKNSFVGEGCIVKGKIQNSVVSTGSVIEEDAIVINSVIMPNSVVKSGAVVRYSIIGEECVVGENATVGVIPDDSAKERNICTIGKGTVIEPGKIIE